MRAILTTIATVAAITSATADDTTGAIRYGYIQANCWQVMNFGKDMEAQRIKEWAAMSEQEIKDIVSDCRKKSAAQASANGPVRDIKDPPPKVVEQPRPAPPPRVVERKRPAECIISLNYYGPGDDITLKATGGNVGNWQKVLPLRQGANKLMVPCSIAWADKITFDCYCGKSPYLAAPSLAIARQTIDSGENVFNPDKVLTINDNCDKDASLRQQRTQTPHRTAPHQSASSTFRATVVMPGLAPSRPHVSAPINVGPSYHGTVTSGRLR
ncbi:hypothetical protein KW798_03045 [Candidatus Parcubacteria bacterium]|nr:hypothetical protein [Candidatus Parcubacteria bacterium]